MSWTDCQRIMGLTQDCCSQIKSTSSAVLACSQALSTAHIRGATIQSDLIHQDRLGPLSRPMVDSCDYC
ncbi:unnamed protein product [Pleuronectes platessa]|uniref:Uncharacterized protein n=1 Tax=Pleuronectes platessa TaxID=8262 RepID=A0A9N7VYN0_PLEPL|nr:unnamed protein product [Pleuronectes platessa]